VKLRPQTRKTETVEIKVKPTHMSLEALREDWQKRTRQIKKAGKRRVRTSAFKKLLGNCVKVEGKAKQRGGGTLSTREKAMGI